MGAKLPEVARRIIESYTEEEDAKRSKTATYGLVVQGVSAVLLIAGLALHIAPVGFHWLGINYHPNCIYGNYRRTSFGCCF